LPAVVALLVSCAAMESGYEPALFGGAVESAEEMPGGYVDTDTVPSPEGMAAERTFAQPAAASREVSTGEMQTESVSVTDSSADTATQPVSPQERLRVFSADLEISVPSVSVAREEAITYVESIGGYVESSGESYLVVRVPAPAFDASLARLEALGELLSRSVSTADVTDQYLDLDRRLQIAETSRERLYELLERAEDADERVSILREIRRLTEEIEQLRNSLDSLSRLIQFSRITISLVARIQTTRAALSTIPFSWIAQLDPLRHTLGRASRAIEVTPPEDFAVFSQGALVSAESADGVRFRVSARANQPEGDAAFWQEALSYHLSPLYRTATPIEAGAFRGVRLESKDISPFVYVVAVMVRENETLVAEVFYPDLNAEAAHEAAIVAALEAAQ
jgi:hypothetical protein